MFIYPRKRQIAIIRHASARISHAVVLLSILASSTISVGAASARTQDTTTSSSNSANNDSAQLSPADQTTYSPPKIVRSEPRIGERPEPAADLQNQTSYPAITCLLNCTQLDANTVAYSGSGTASGTWQYRPPVRYRREVQAMRVYYYIKGLRVVSQNVGCGVARDHYLVVEAYPAGKVFYQSPIYSVPPNAYQEFVVPTVNTWIDHSSLNRETDVRWVIVRSGISCSVTYTWTADQIVISSKPIDLALLYDDSAVNLAACKDGDCEVGASIHGAIGTAADPVHTRSGAFSYANADLSVPTSAGNLIFERSYSSATVDRPADSLAPGWTHNHAERLVFPGDPGGVSGYVIFRGTAGNDYLFKDNGNSTYTAAPGVTASLTRASGPPVTYTLKTSAQSVFTFDAAGRLDSRQDAQGHAFTYSYDGNGRLAQVSADGGTRYLAFAYDAQGRVESVADHTGREISFGYDGAGDLTGFTDVLNQAWTYAYDATHHLTEVVDPGSKETVRNEYEIISPSPIDFTYRTINSYAGQNVNSTAVREDNGLTLHITGNGWRRITYPYTITPKTVLEFDFKSTVQGEIHGIGFDNNDTSDGGRIFQLYGSDTSAGTNLVFNDYAASAPGWKHYKINLYDYYSGGGFAGGQLYLFFVNDHDVPSPTAESYFSDIRVYDDPVYSVARQYNGEGELTAEFQYNANRTTTITDALGNQATHTYDLKGTLIEQTDPLNADTNKTYDTNFRPKTITDPAGHTTTLTWSTDGANLTRVVDAELNQTDITYDSLNNPTSIIDPRDFLTTYTYSGTLLTSVTDALNQTTTYTYTTEGYLESVTDALNHTTSYTYDSHGQRTSMTDALNNTWTYSYDSLGRLVDTTDPLARVTHNEYDAAGRLTRVTQNYDALRPQNDGNQWNIVTAYGYDVRGNLTSVTDTLGRVTQYAYDDADRLISTTDPDGNVTAQAYNTAGQLVSTTDALLRTTAYTYDNAGRLTSASGPLGSGSGTTYNPDGTVASTTDALGRVTSYAYDSLKRVTSVTQPNSGVTQYAYDASGNLISTTDPLSNTTTYEYDALNRLIRETDALGGVTEHFYDAAGNRVQTIDPRDNATTNAYDAANRLISVTDALNHVTTYEYDDLGRRTATVDADGNRTEYTYDGLDRVEAVTDPLVHTTSTAYDPLGNVLSQTDANNFATSFAYDVLNRLTAQTDPLNGVTSFTYDDVGNRLTVTDPNLHTTSFTYDALNRASAVTDANSHTTTTTYDVVGNVVSVTDPLNHTTSYAYNPINQQDKVIDPLLNETRYLYNARGDLILMTNAEGVVTKYEFDALGRLTSVVENYQAGIPVDAETNVRTEYTYDPNGNRLTIMDGNGHVTTFAYDALNRLTSETDPLNHTWTYTYDAVGNRTSLIDANGATTTYVYDNANRLTNIDYPGTSIDVSFAYDAGNRRLSMTDGLGTTTWAYDSLDRPTAITDPFNATVGYDYDAVGNRTELTYPGGQSVTYTYDPGNRLVLVNGFSTAVGYTYDDADRLIEIARPNNINTAYVYDNASRLLSITHAQGVVLNSSFEYTYDDVGNRIQVIEDVKLPGLPPLPTSTPTSTPTAANTATSTATLTPTPTDTGLPTDTPTPTDTSEFTPTPSDTPEFTFTPSETPTETLTASETPTASDTPAATDTPTYTPAVTPTDTETATLTPSPSDTATATATPILTLPPTSTATPLPSGPITITYTYDPLYRLIVADYSTGDYYHYAYDAVGNRLTQESAGIPLPTTVTYTYDDANRLVSVNGVAYAWDANGNLLSDGVNTYAYDPANRLISINATNTYAYNGLGDRHQQTVGAQTTTYALDLNAGLTQVLDDGTHSYTYGLSRLAQVQGTGGEYFLGEALGSVRQLTHESGVVTMAKAYDPYGNVTTSAGLSSSIYGYTAEQTDITGMVYLRARYYTSQQGRFLTRDTWDGNPNNPITLNRWAYANANPVMYIDPSGRSSVRTAILSDALSRSVPGNMPMGMVNFGIDCPSAAEDMPDWLYFAIGALDQYLEDLTIGIFKADGNYDDIYIYQQGRGLGRGISLTQVMIETVIGLAMAEAALSSIPPTLGGGTLCAAVTGGGCFVITIPVVGVEVLVLIGGSLVAIHGAAMAARMAADDGGGGWGMFGGRGTQFTSKTFWTSKEGRVRLDAENPAPGRRPGNIHIQDKVTGEKYYYNPSTEWFDNLPREIERLISNDSSFSNALETALRYLGE